METLAQPQTINVSEFLYVWMGHSEAMKFCLGFYSSLSILFSFTYPPQKWGRGGQQEQAIERNYDTVVTEKKISFTSQLVII